MSSNYQGVLGFVLGIGVSWFTWIAVAALSWALLRPAWRRRGREEAIRELLRAAAAAPRRQRA
ncbi:MAG TPA: hypothetical protein VFP65_19640 [Anaeromyxobacteraceae bacterium]|nr:hypothetical protein [Anaeromyxobacteraceae bacterium]